MGIEELNAQYATLKTQYDALAAQTVADPSKLQTNLPQLQTLNTRMATILDQMLTEMQYAGQDANSEAYRDQLVEQLTQIQSDYNGLKTNTDALQTLKRIRSFQDTSWQPTLNFYVALFVLVAIALVLVVVFRGQIKEIATAPITSPTAIAPLT